MIIKPYKTELEKLKLEGDAALDELLNSNYQENFYFDFKNISTQGSDKALSTEDRKNLAKAISGFSNTSGGLIIWGIKDNRDNTFSKKPIKNTEKFIGLLNDAISKLSLPIMSGINSFNIKDDQGDGYIITEIPKHFFSPVQVSPALKIEDIPGRYYIRSGSDFVVASHDIISSLYNRQEQSSLGNMWTLDPAGGYQESEHILNCGFGFTIQNKGLGVLRDIWVNYTTYGGFSDGVKVRIEQTKHLELFTGWDFHGLALNLITNDSYKMGPQQFLTPFLIRFIFDKRYLGSFTKEANLYISFGSQGSAPHEITLSITPEKVRSFLESKQKDGDRFASHFGLNQSLDYEN